MHPEYERLTQTIQTALKSARLDDIVEIEGPNKLGGYRLMTGTHRVGLSRLPDDHLWCVSVWVDALDDLGVLSAREMNRRALREEIIGVTACVRDAVKAAIEVIVEARIDEAWDETPTTRAPEPSDERDLPHHLPAVLRTARAVRANFRRAPLKGRLSF